MTLLLFQVSYCIKIQLAGSIGFDKRKPEISVQKLNRVNMVIAKIRVSVTVGINAQKFNTGLTVHTFSPANFVEHEDNTMMMIFFILIAYLLDEVLIL